MKDIRRGDVLDFADGVAEVQRVDANNEGGFDICLRYSERREDLQLNVLRAGGPDERDDDKDVRREEAHDLRDEEPVDEDVDEDDDDESEDDEDF